MRVVLASSNSGKLGELRDLLAPWGYDVVSQGELGIRPGPETALTFLENALHKARHASRESGLPAIGDDSGLVVDVLNGAPGILSARYAGEGATDADNNHKLIDALGECPDASAHFYCAVVYMRDPTDPAPLISTGSWHGRIIREPRGRGGFGYDPHFFIEALGRSAAELTRAEKSRLSHRGQAVRGLCSQLAQQA